MFTMLAKALAGELKREMGPAQPQPRPGELRRRAALVGGVSGQTRTATIGSNAPKVSIRLVGS